MNFGIQRRVADALEAMSLSNLEAAALHTFPAIDATGKARRPAASVGDRFRAFIQDQIGIIAPLGLCVVLGRDCTFGGVSIEDALYKLGRCTLLHEGGLSDRLAFREARASILGGDWLLSSQFLCALLVAVVSARENSGLSLKHDAIIEILGKRSRVNSLWGAEDRVRSIILEQWPTKLDPALLSPYAT